MFCLRSLLLPLLLLTMVPLSLAGDEPAEDDLVALMGGMQTFAHKLQLAIDHDNAALASFYAHELEEVIEQTTEAADYEGHAIGPLTSAMLLPAFGLLEDSLASGDILTSGQRFDAVITACNACHQATEHGYIVISRNPENPYLQSFAPQD